MRNNSHARIYRDGVPERFDGANVTALHLSNNAVAQVSENPQGCPPGFLLRVWPPNELHEYGGSNLTALSVCIEFDNEGTPYLVSLHVDRPTSLEGKQSIAKHGEKEDALEQKAEHDLEDRVVYDRTLS